VDADRLARETTAQPEVLAAIVAEFGPGVLDAHGTLDRKSLAQRVFGDTAARRRLEAITHPPIRQAIRQEIEAAKRAGTSLLLDIPLLLESGWVPACDHVVFVHASDAVRAARAAGRGWSADELARREAAQSPLAEKRAHAGFTIDNDGPREAMARQVEQILQQLAATR
jgi:dephospho-CoA kinase